MQYFHRRRAMLIAIGVEYFDRLVKAGFINRNIVDGLYNDLESKYRIIADDEAILIDITAYYLFSRSPEAGENKVA